MGTDCRALVADDDVDVCSLIVTVLQAHCLVTVVHDAERAIATLEKEPPFDIIISDHMLPGISGIEFVERVRRAPLTLKTPILIISGNGDGAMDERVRAAGANAFLNKPFSLAQLRGTVDRLLSGTAA